MGKLIGKLIFKGIKVANSPSNGSQPTTPIDGDVLTRMFLLLGTVILIFVVLYFWDNKRK